MLGYNVRYAVPATALIVCMAYCTVAKADTQGPNFATAAVNLVITGDAWATPTNALTTNGVRSTASTSGANFTDQLYLRSFGFNIPADATIKGIQVHVLAHESTGTPASPYIGIFPNHPTLGITPLGFSGGLVFRIN